MPVCGPGKQYTNQPYKYSVLRINNVRNKDLEQKINQFCSHTVRYFLPPPYDSVWKTKWLKELLHVDLISWILVLQIGFHSSFKQALSIMYVLLLFTFKLRSIFLDYFFPIVSLQLLFQRKSCISSEEGCISPRNVLQQKAEQNVLIRIQ